MKLKLNKQSKIYFILNSIRNINNKNYYKYLSKINKDNSNIFELTSYGDKQKSKSVYYIKFDGGGSNYGFFAIFRSLICAIYISDRFKFEPLIELVNTCYQEKCAINGTNNPFEYFFEQPGSIKLSELNECSNVIMFQMGHVKFAEKLINGLHEKNILATSYVISDDYYNIMAGLVSKYIVFNIETKKYLNDSLKLHNIGNEQIYKTLGVHIRGADYSMNLNMHPKLVKPNEYIQHVITAIDQYKFNQIFLATDDVAALELFKTTFGDKLTYFSDVSRSETNIGVHASESERGNHHFLLGLEVLRDMYTLSKCQGLISGLSHVSITARIFKKSYNEDYEFVKVIDQGLNSNKKDTRFYLKHLTGK